MKRSLRVVLPLVLISLLAASPGIAAVGNASESAGLPAFAKGSKTLSKSQLQSLTGTVKQKSVATSLRCIGVRLASEPNSVLTLAKARAKTVCDRAKKLNPQLSTTVATKVSMVASERNTVALSFQIPAFPTKPLTLDALDVDWVGRVAVSNVLNYLDNAPVLDINRTVVQAPNVPKAFADSRLALLDRAAKAFGAEFSESYNVVFFSEKDGAWAQQKLNELGGSFPGSLEQYVNSLPSARQCGFAFSTWDKRGAPIYYACLNSLSYLGLGADHTPIHEYFHFVQNTKYQTAENYIPLWINEGPPVLFGFALAYGSKDRANLSAEKFFGYAPLFDPNGTGVVDTKRVTDFMKSATDAEIVKLYTQLELDPANRDALNHYGFGGIAAQVLIAVYDVETYFDFLERTRFATWQVAFEQTYGLSPAEFYVKIAPYIRALAAKRF